MIDFRYHLVSIVAVFLALAIGIVVGAGALSPQVANTLNTESKQLAKRNTALYTQNSQLRAQIAADNAFGATASGLLLDQLLRGENVVLVTAPGADGSTVTGITSALRRSGATVTGQVSLTPQFLDTSASTETTLTTLASQLTPAGVSLSGPAPVAQIAGQQAAAQLIAAAIMDRHGQPLVTTAESTSILAGFGQQGFLHISGPNGSTALAAPASLAVVVIPATPPVPANASSPANLALVMLANQLQASGSAALLAGSLPGSGAGSAIDAVTSGSSGVSVTTVDDANTAIGQIIVVQALRRALDPHVSPASYGVGPGTVPSPAPSTAPTPTPSPSASHSATPRPGTSTKAAQG
ncbi:MAG: copper transporter [Streptosporangiaceae bacterium]